MRTTIGIPGRRAFAPLFSAVVCAPSTFRGIPGPLGFAQEVPFARRPPVLPRKSSLLPFCDFAAGRLTGTAHARQDRQIFGGNRTD